MIPRLKPDLGWRELRAALSSPGDGDVERFELAFAREMGQRHAIAFPYGRTGLMLLLETLGIQGREVICPAYTCTVVAHAIVHSGNEPVFVDCAEGSFNMDLDAAEDAINAGTGALVATSLFGFPVDLDRLDEIRRRHPRVNVIQDCAHSFAARWRERPVHPEGVAALFGLNASKLMTSIFGGMVTTDDDDLAARLRARAAERLRPATLGKSTRRLLYFLSLYPAFSRLVYGAVNRLERLGLLASFVRYYDEGEIDMPADHLEAMTAVEARVGRAQLRRYREIVAARRSRARRYDESARDLPGLDLPPLVEGATYSHYVPVTEQRADLLRRARRHGVQLGEVVEYTVPSMRAYRDRAGSTGTFPVSERYSRQVVNLPIHAGMTPAALERTVRVLRRCLRPAGSDTE